MEKNEVYYMPLYERIFSIILGILSLYLIYYAINLNTHDSIFIALPMFIIVFLVMLIFIEGSFVKYIFEEDMIVVKFPLLQEKICYLNDIIGFSFLNIKSESAINIYTENNRITIKMEGKRLREKVNEFVNNNYARIKNKNIKKLEEHGIKYLDSKNKNIMFYRDKMEIYKNDIKIKTYYFDKDIKNVKCFDFQMLTFYTNDNEKIGINIYKSKGCIGLFEYIIEKYNNGVRQNGT